MGRKTWDSIPPRFRPLKDRLNVVISRSHASGTVQVPADVSKEPVRVSSLEQAVSYLRSKPQGTLGRVFVIGGAQIYAAALKLREAKRILLTRVLTDYDCDVSFPLSLEGEIEGSKGSEGRAPGWVRSTKTKHDAWVGEEVLEGVQEENGAKYEFQMWERVD
jgi:dihydrofolate reductase